MPKKRRGRPPKSKLSMQDTNIKDKDSPKRNEEDVGYDVNLRRESYNSFSINSEPTLATVYGQKQLKLVNKYASYRESLWKFSKNLGPTARKIAHRMLQRQGLMSYQAQHRMEPMLSPPDSQRHTLFVPVNSIKQSLGYTNTNQSSQPLIKLGESSANYKGKNIMVDDGKTDGNKRGSYGGLEFLFEPRTKFGNSSASYKGKNIMFGDPSADYKGKSVMVDNEKTDGNKRGSYDGLEFLFGKQKGGVKIGNGSSDNKDFVYKNVGYDQVRNESKTNPVGSAFSNYNRIACGDKEDICHISKVTPRNAKPNSVVYPSTYVQPSRNVFSPLKQLDRGGSSSPWVSLPFMNEPPPVKSLQNWYLPPSETRNQGVINDSLKEQELQLSLALKMQTTDQESNIWSQRLWALSQPNQFPRPDQVLPLQDQLLMPQRWSQRAMLGANPERYYSLPFGTHQDFGFQKGNNLQHPPPDI